MKGVDKKRGAVLFFAIMIFANFISASIYINEVELNPSGTDEGHEWIELYNNGSNENLDDYYIQNSLKENYSLSGTINDYYVLGSLSGLGNIDDLKLFKGNLSIDSTGSLTDTSDNDNTWSRIPDGGSFSFQQQTIGATNVPETIISDLRAPSCIVNGETITLSAKVSGACIQNVLFSVYANNTWMNFTGILTNGENYSGFVQENLFSGGNVDWKVYSRNCVETTESSTESFYVNYKTILNINPSLPDGINGWYISRPEFSLENPDATSIYYRWDSTTTQTYSSSFGLENAPNNANVSGGVHKLNYWSVLSCGKTESTIEKVLKFDFTDPSVLNIVPINNSVIFLNPRPLIQARVDEIYQSNSGINLTKISMTLDNEDVSDKLTISKTGNDAIVRLELNEDLSEGKHTVKLTAYDNAGRIKDEEWSFFINMSTPEFDIIIHDPIKDSYGTKKVPLNISTTRFVQEISIMNLNDNRPRFSRLCGECNEYGSTRKKTRTMNEGNNTIIIRAVDEYGTIKEKNATFFVDSKAPKISNIIPKKNQIINGSNFYIKYNEDNLNNITLFVNDKNKTLDGCESGNKQECRTTFDLSLFNDMFIDFYFEVSDLLHITRSKDTRVFVDTTSPLLSITLPLENETYYGKKVPFNITVSEEADVEYYDYQDTRPKWKRLCTNCVDYGNTKSKVKSFKPGFHDVLIIAVDNAGNADTKEIKFYVA